MTIEVFLFLICALPIIVMIMIFTLSMVRPVRIKGEYLQKAVILSIVIYLILLVMTFEVPAFREFLSNLLQKLPY